MSAPVGQQVYSTPANQAWALVWKQLLETGTKAIQSNPILNGSNPCAIDIAQTASDCVFKTDKVRLLHYRPLTKRNGAVPPLLICYGLFGRQTMIDLQEDRSLIRALLLAGHDVYVIDWGNPTRADQYLDFDDYIDDYLGACVDFVRQANDNNSILLFGICEGGTLAASYTALHPSKISALALAITPIDFPGNEDEFKAGEGYINSWLNHLSETDVDTLIDNFGMLPGQITGAVFSGLTPISSITKYNLGLEAIGDDEGAMLNFLRMEKWIADRPDHPGEAARQWLNDFYRNNNLVKGTFEVCGQAVDLANISCPVLNIYAERDHIVPVSCTKALANFIPDDRYEEIGFDGGHVGVFVSRKAQGVVAAGIIEWAERITPQ